MINPINDPLDKERDHDNNESIIEIINNIFILFELFCIKDISPNKNIVIHILPKVIETSVNPEIRSTPSPLNVYKYTEEIPMTTEEAIIVIKK